MSIYKNEKQIIDIRKIILPEEFQQVEHIDNDGDAYINTLFKPNGNTAAEVKFQRLGTDTDGSGIFGARYAPGERSFVFILGSDTYYSFPYGATTNTKGKWTTDRNQPHIISRNKGLSYLDGVQQTNNGLQSFQCPYNALLFTYNNGGSHATTKKYRVWYCIIWDNTTLIRYLVPCYYKSNNEAGFYDIIGENFYSKQGSGNFIVGPDYTPHITKIYKDNHTILI